MELVELPNLGGILTKIRWKWLGHVLRMNDSRWPARVIQEQLGPANESKRVVGAPKKNWLQIVIDESWRKIDWKKFAEHVPGNWTRWKRGDWFNVLRRIAADRRQWREVVNEVVIASQ
jgi:hypothetical protein